MNLIIISNKILLSLKTREKYFISKYVYISIRIHQPTKVYYSIHWWVGVILIKRLDLFIHTRKYNLKDNISRYP